MITLKHDRANMPLKQKILLKHLADAIPLITHELRPFMDYTRLPNVRVEADKRTHALHVHSSGIKYPTNTIPYYGWAEFYFRDGEDVWVDSYEHTWLVGDLNKLTPERAAQAFCSANRDGFLRAFTALANYHEATLHLEV